MADLLSTVQGLFQGDCANRRCGVSYQGNLVSDPFLKTKLSAIAWYLDSPIALSSGDRQRVVNGNLRSLHLQGRAADFSVPGMSLAQAFEEIKDSGLIDEGYEFIYHTEKTGAPHLHLGRLKSSGPSKFIVDRGQILHQD